MAEAGYDEPANNEMPENNEMPYDDTTEANDAPGNNEMPYDDTNEVNNEVNNEATYEANNDANNDDNDGGYDGNEVNNEIKEPPKPAEPEPVAEPEPEPPKPKPKKKKPTGKYSVPSAFKAISKDRNPINWYTAKLVNPKKANGKLKFDKCGNDGISELQEYLKGQADQIIFALLRVNSLDKSNSIRAKFVFFRFLGSKVGVMTKAKLNPQKETIQNQFPVRHMDVNISEDLKGCDIESLSKEFLRIGGAHKPDKYDYGGGKVFNCK